MKNWRNEKEHFEKLILEVFTLEELQRSQEMRIDEFSRQEFRESHATIHVLTSQIQELQERVNFMNDSREFQDVESACSQSTQHRHLVEECFVLGILMIQKGTWYDQVQGDL